LIEKEAPVDPEKESFKLVFHCAFGINCRLSLIVVESLELELFIALKSLAALEI